ncbi:hypothetical protein B9Z55_007540 [Caenorhabditis nigoni]|uniref:Serpentine Receptor, class H n=1 Tax=Caenorhabditis nigoni TaxID=1611254 RepID=A0A2G5VAE4_9PELO|nr:hypothetical protein B9Z55_007540 [Caenorhabditis nigoni]
MNNVKLSLLNLNFWYLSTGLLYSYLSTPYFFYPHLAGFYIGFLSDFGVSNAVQSYIGCPVSFAMIISIMSLFENRSSLIINNIFSIKKSRTRILWTSGNFLVCMGLVTPIYLNLPDQVIGRKDLLKELPCPPISFFTESILIFAYSGFWETYSTTIILLINTILLFQTLFFSTCCLYYLLYAKSNHVSSETRRLQTRSFYATVLQTAIPILCLLIPTIIFMLKNETEQYSQTKNNVTFLPAILHKGIGSLCIILVHYPYRKFLISFIFCERNKKTIVKVSHCSAQHF